MSPPPSTMPQTALDLAAAFILDQLDLQRTASNANHGGSQSADGGRASPPLFVGLQGPQGSGKSYLASKLPARLAELAQARSSETPLRTVSVSLDDLYLPWSELKGVAAENPGNKLLSGRGQAGTHDLQLAKTVLEQFKTAYRNPDAEAVIPVFEKSLHGGEGDRLDRSEWVRIEMAGDVDIVLFEGWMNGFQPSCRSPGGDDLQQKYRLATERPEEAKQAFRIDYDRPFFLEHSLQHLRTVERNLREYTDLWSYIDTFVQLKPERLGYVWEWRLEQEHNMKAKNGGVGMTDEQVKDFIARYMPGYELWLPNVTEGDNPWRGRGLQIQLNKAREAVAVEKF
ncbi:D-glycerate 3-kinase [Rhodotorula sp. JG-1b]|nr:D-glycerate 3-kinase [Rhodotorula sp. JG-1b]